MSVDTSQGHPAMDYAEHKKTYAGFLRITKIVIVCSGCLACRHEDLLGLRSGKSRPRPVILSQGSSLRKVCPFSFRPRRWRKSLNRTEKWSR